MRTATSLLLSCLALVAFSEVVTGQENEEVHQKGATLASILRKTLFNVRNHENEPQHHNLDALGTQLLLGKEELVFTDIQELRKYRAKKSGKLPENPKTHLDESDMDIYEAEYKAAHQEALDKAKAAAVVVAKADSALVEDRKRVLERMETLLSGLVFAVTGCLGSLYLLGFMGDNTVVPEKYQSNFQALFLAWVVIAISLMYGDVKSTGKYNTNPIDKNALNLKAFTPEKLQEFTNLAQEVRTALEEKTYLQKKKEMDEMMGVKSNLVDLPKPQSNVTVVTAQESVDSAEAEGGQANSVTNAVSEDLEKRATGVGTIRSIKPHAAGVNLKRVVKR